MRVGFMQADYRDRDHAPHGEDTDTIAYGRYFVRLS